MAGRPQLQPGQLGSVTYETTLGGRVLARARSRDAGGKPVRLTGNGTDEESALAALRRNASALVFEEQSITPLTTMRDLMPMWLSDREGEVRPQTLRQYGDTVRWLSPMIGELSIAEMRPARIRKVLDQVARDRSTSSRDKARIALSGSLSIAVEADVLDANPLLSVRASKRTPHVPVAFTVDQVAALRAAILDREDKVRPRAGETASKMLRWVTEIQLGSGLRISEVLALRHMDVDLEAGCVSVSGVLVLDDGWHLIRQEELKSRDQARIIELPGFALDCLRDGRASCHDLVSRQATAPALPGRSAGKHPSPNNVRRALRALRASDTELQAALAATGLSTDDLVPHALRRTAATLVAVATGSITQSQALLGHANSATTTTFYRGAAYKQVGSAKILDSLLGERPA